MKASAHFYNYIKSYRYNCLKTLVLIIVVTTSVFKTEAQETSFKEVLVYNEYQKNSIKEIFQDEFNMLWFATNQGVLKFDGTTFEELQNKENLQRIKTIVTANDSLFIGTENALYLKTAATFKSFKSKEINKIYAHKNTYFIGTNQGIFYFNKNYLQPLQTTYALDFSKINDIIFYDNAFIIASNNGLWKINDLFEPNKITLISKGNYTALLENKDKLLVVKNATFLEELNRKGNFHKIYTTKSIKSIAAIRNKIFVVTKEAGIDVLNANTFIFENRIHKYNSNLTSNKITAVYQDIENNIFIATTNGLFIKKNKAKLVKPPLKIEEILVNYKLLDSINLPKYTATLQLKHHQNNLSFLLQSTSISNPRNIEYRFKLESDFSPWSTNKQVVFTNLKSNSYQFVAESRFKNSTEVATTKFSFYIDTPFYKKIWFLVVVAILLLLCMLVVLEFYIRSIKIKNQKKIIALELKNHLYTLEQKALQLQMNPHFIFNVLNGIKALGNSDRKQELNKTISQFSILLRSVLNNSRLEEISLKEEITTITNYLELEQKMNSKKFVFSIKEKLNEIASEEILIPPMLMQPFIENAIKHGISKVASEGKITIKFEVKESFLICTVLDNGIGVFQSQKTHKNHTSIALKVTQERIKNLSKYSNFSIKEIVKEHKILGTSVYFRVPLKTDY